jgi:hypothetical protein
MSEPTGKGHATPTRKAAEAARKQTLKGKSDSKQDRKNMRTRDNAARRELRRAMYTLDEKHLPLRDKGAVRRFVRTWVDSRISVAELFVPLAFIIMIVLFYPNQTVQVYVSLVWVFMFVGLVIDTAILGFRLKRTLKKEFPNEDLRGVVFYGITRSITFRPMRMPKPNVKIGGAPKDVKVPKSLA